MKVPTGSSLDRAANCAASHVLPWSPMPDSEAGARGTGTHGFLEHAHENRHAALLLAPEDMRDHLRGFDVPEMHPPWQAEIPMALDVEKRGAWPMAKRGHRNYPPQRDGTVFMTLDSTLRVFAEVPGAGLQPVDMRVTDYKTGWAPAPEDSLQIKAAVAAIALSTGAQRVVGTILKIDDIANPWRMEHVFDAFEIDEAYLAVQKTVRMVEAEATFQEHGKEPNTSPGPWCKFCPAMPSCPSQQRALSLAARLLPAENERAQRTPAELLAAYRALVALTERVEAEIKILARVAPIPTRPGKVWAETERKEHVIMDHDKAFAKLSEEFPPGIVESYIHRNVTMKALKGIVKEQAAVRGVKAAPLEREVIATLRKAGLLRVERGFEFREVNEGKALPPGEDE